MIIVKIKPLSVNQCWQGRRFKTKKYKDYEQELLLILPPLKIEERKLELFIECGLSSSLADIDNLSKPFIDILQKKYNFNDKNIFKLIMEKHIVKKGKEYIAFFLKDYVNSNTNT